MDSNSQKRFPLFVSIGNDCQAAHQVRRVTQWDSALFFDWLITPLESCRAIYMDDNLFFQTRNWEIVADGVRVRDKGTGLEYQHEFQVKDKASLEIDRELVESHLGIAKNKFLHLKYKTLNVIKSAQECYLIRKDVVEAPEEAAAISNDLLKLYLPLNKKIRIIIASENAQKEAFSSTHAFVKIKKGGTWTGDDPSWDRLFAMTISWFSFITLASNNA